MADIVRSINGRIEYLKSVNTPEYEGVGVLVNPDLTAVLNVPLKYWKISNGQVVEMTQAEKDAITAQELQARKDTADNYQVDLKIALTALIKVINLRLPAGQKITKQEMIDALKEEIT